MKVLKIEVKDPTLDASLARMKSGLFRASDLAALARDTEKTSEERAGRIADRMIQRHRKLGNIERVPGRLLWIWVGK